MGIFDCTSGESYSCRLPAAEVVSSASKVLFLYVCRLEDSPNLQMICQANL
jgi:hypothetical protein